jgi:hypothetical protein
MRGRNSRKRGGGNQPPAAHSARSRLKHCKGRGGRRKCRLERIRLDTATRSTYEKVRTAFERGCAAIAATPDSGRLMAGVVGRFREVMAKLDYPQYRRLRERLEELEAALLELPARKLTPAARKLASYLAGALARIGALASNLALQEARHIAISFDPLGPLDELLQPDRENNAARRVQEFEAAIEHEVLPRLDELLQLIRRRTQRAARSLSRAAGPPPPPHGPRYALTLDTHFWQVTFDGQQATWKDGKGLRYVAYLLERPSDAIHGATLAAKAGGAHDIQEGPVDGEEDPTEKRIRGRARELQEILEDPRAADEEKEDARKELEGLWRQLQALRRPETNRERAVRAVRRDLQRLQHELGAAKDRQGHPHPVLVPFAEHIHRHILLPSGRYAQRPRSVARQGLAGRFIYEAPAGVSWRVSR